MRIKRFLGHRIHGYLNFDISLFDDLTFLTGINGSGKTSVVRGISALISPSLMALASIDHARMEVHIQTDTGDLTIWSEKSKDTLRICNSRAETPLEIHIVPDDEPDVTHESRDRLITYYRDLETQHASHPALAALRSLPAPMFLGIARRATDLATERYFRYRLGRRLPGAQYSNSMFASLEEAAALAESTYHQIQARQKEVTDELRKELILSAFRYEESYRLSLEQWGLKDIISRKQVIASTLQRLGLTSEEISAQLDPFFQKLERISERLPSSKDVGGILSSSDKAAVNTIVEWFANVPQFDRINRLLVYVDKFVKRTQEANEPIARYLSIVNEFLQDSRKSLEFDSTGRLLVRIRDSQAIPITSLSSGESQIVVIITHLAFNPAARLANVFIVDEPELSLHIRWQELFVGAVQKANPTIQLILATHSPSIILDEVKHCVDLTELNR